MKNISRLLLLALLPLLACEDLRLGDQLTPDRQQVISNGSDLQEELQAGYVRWWQSLHGPSPAITLGVTGDAYGLPWDDFGAFRMGQEPRQAFQNQNSEPAPYRAIAETPWYGCLSAASSANQVLLALREDVSIDQGGPQDQSVEAAARALRGLAWGYLGLLFDQAPLLTEEDDLSMPPAFSPYPEVIDKAVAELQAAINLSEAAGIDFFHTYFPEQPMDGLRFARFCRSYAARFLAQQARTVAENETTDWAEVATLAEQGLQTTFAPAADGQDWTSYHQFTLANTGEGPFWARVDQRLIAAIDPSQPARYPQVQSEGAAPLDEPQAQSADARLQSDFRFDANIPFPADRGEWHFSHYQHRRHEVQPELMGNGVEGPMPAFLAMDNQLLLAEAYLRTGRKAEAVQLINGSSRLDRGQLPGVNGNEPDEVLLQAIYYERAIELLNTAPAGLWLDRRRWAEREFSESVSALGGLQLGSPAQLPVPAAEARVNDIPVYSFGGVKDPEGIDPFFY